RWHAPRKDCWLLSDRTVERWARRPELTEQFPRHQYRLPLPRLLYLQHLHLVPQWFRRWLVRRVYLEQVRCLHPADSVQPWHGGRRYRRSGGYNARLPDRGCFPARGRSRLTSRDRSCRREPAGPCGENLLDSAPAQILPCTELSDL